LQTKHILQGRFDFVYFLLLLLLSLENITDLLIRHLPDIYFIKEIFNFDNVIIILIIKLLLFRQFNLRFK
jgi:hypothetical protein